MADPDVDHGRDLHGHVDPDVVVGDVVEGRLQGQLLLEAGAEQPDLLALGDGQDRLVVELGVVQAAQQPQRPGPEVARQTPTRPVALAYPVAMSAAASS